MKMFVAIHVGILRIEENDRKFKCEMWKEAAPEDLKSVLQMKNFIK